MEKLYYAIWKHDGETEAALNARLLGPVREKLTRLGVERLKINVIDEHVAAAPLYTPSVRPQPAATVQFWLNAAHARPPYEAVLQDAAPRIAGWSVVESVVLPNRVAVPDGTRTRGFCQIAFITRLPQMPQEGFLDVWLDSHTANGVATQDTFYYCQNVVLRALTPGAPHWAGIVDECYPIEALTDPHVYWKSGGSDAVRDAHIKTEIDSSHRFIDMRQVNVLMTSEYRFGGWHDADRGWHERTAD